MKLLPLILSLVIPVAFTARAFADDDSPAFCDESLEGSYGGQFGNAPFRLNLMCIDGSRMVASFSDQDPAKRDIHASMIISLPYVGVDGSNVVISVASLRPEDRRGISSKSLYTYLKLDRAELRAGRMAGTFFNGNVRSFLPVSGRRLQEFPRPAPAGASFEAGSVAGTYAFTMPTLGPGVLLIDVLFGAPFVSLQLSDGQSIHLIDSAKWDGTGLLSAASTAGDGEADGKKLFYLRGKMLSERELELYLVTPVAGLLGPFRATKN